MAKYRAIVRDDDPEDDLWGEVAVEAENEQEAEAKTIEYLQGLIAEGGTTLNMSALKLTVGLA